MKNVYVSAIPSNTHFITTKDIPILIDLNLCVCLAGKASDTLESLETTNANYQVTWEISEKYYDHPTAVIIDHVRSFLELPNCTNASAPSLEDLLNNMSKHYRALEILNKPFFQAFPIYAVTSRLDPQNRLN